MTLCERNTGSRFQVALEGDRALLVVEFNYHINEPGTMPGCMNRVAGVVLRLKVA
jgi:hypothetical protein